MGAVKKNAVKPEAQAAKTWKKFATPLTMKSLGPELRRDRRRGTCRRVRRRCPVLC
jgi:hypothetical protein